MLHTHADDLKKLSRRKKLILAGPFTDDNNNAIQTLMADSREEAETLVRQDPSIASKYYDSSDLFELIEADESNNWLKDDPQAKGNLRVG